jgi:hypothetical protein
MSRQRLVDCPMCAHEVIFDDPFCPYCFGSRQISQEHKNALERQSQEEDAE